MSEADWLLKMKSSYLTICSVKFSPSFLLLTLSSSCPQVTCRCFLINWLLHTYHFSSYQLAILMHVDRFFLLFVMVFVYTFSFLLFSEQIFVSLFSFLVVTLRGQNMLSFFLQLLYNSSAGNQYFSVHWILIGCPLLWKSDLLRSVTISAIFFPNNYLVLPIISIFTVLGYFLTLNVPVSFDFFVHVSHFILHHNHNNLSNSIQPSTTDIPVFFYFPWPLYCVGAWLDQHRMASSSKSTKRLDTSFFFCESWKL